MTKNPRYDPDQNETRHAAVSKKDCEEMEKKYRWKLKRVDDRQDTTLKKDCVFDDYCEFPPSQIDLTQGDYKHDD